MSPDTSAVGQGCARVRGVGDGRGLGRSGLGLDRAEVPERGAVSREDGAHDDERRDHRTAGRGSDRGDRTVPGHLRHRLHDPPARDRADCGTHDEHARRPDHAGGREPPGGAAQQDHREGPADEHAQRAGLREREPLLAVGPRVPDVPDEPDVF